MKKIVLLISLIALIAVSCTEKDAFTIEGTLPDGQYNEQLVILQAMDSTWNARKLVNIDTATIVDGKFTFKGLAKEGPMIHYLSLQNAPDFLKRPLMVVVEPGIIKVKMDTVSVIEGTSINNALQALNSKSMRYDKEMRAMYEEVKKDTANTQLKEDFEKRSEEAGKELNADVYKLTKDNIGNQVGVYFFASRFSGLSLDEKNELISLIDPKFKSVPMVQRSESTLATLNATAVGKVYTDQKTKTPDGKDIALSDYVGKDKYVLLDFWASWCGPCIQDMPNVKKAYAEYKDKGFEIVGISLDNSNDAWKKAIEDLGITWPQMSDLKGWESVSATAYGIQYIPQMVLIDKEGKIIDREVGGHNLAEKLGELLN
ncbi:MAG: AhpC/TSA family protein [Prevotella sp.]|jgi:peroxiredoxin|nr:AhpC/TSA family protein [Prevotella sp.]